MSVGSFASAMPIKYRECRKQALLRLQERIDESRTAKGSGEID
jgi:hypothetical protein